MGQNLYVQSLCIMPSNTGEGIFEHSFHVHELFFLHVFSHLLFTKLFNHYYYPHFYPLSTERLSKILKTTNLENVWTHRSTTCTGETPKLLSSHCISFLPDERLTLESLMYQYLATSCIKQPVKGWSPVIRIKYYIYNHTLWFKRTFKIIFKPQDSRNKEFIIMKTVINERENKETRLIKDSTLKWSIQQTNHRLLSFFKKKKNTNKQQ